MDTFVPGDQENMSINDIFISFFFFFLNLYFFLITGDGTGRKRKKAIFDPHEFDLVKISIAKNTNLKSDTKEQSVHSQKMKLKFIFVTPRQLIEKEGKEQKMTRIDLYMKSAGKYDLLGQKEEFRVNSQFALRTGMIGEELCAASDLAQQSVSLCEDSDLRNDLSFDKTLVNDPNAISDDPPALEEEIAFEDDALDQPPSPLPDPDPEPDPEENDKEVSNEKKRKTAEDFLNEPKAPLEDSWEPLEPHEIVTIPKPIRKGRKKAKPADVKQLQTSTSRRDRSAIRNLSNISNINGRVKVAAPIEEFLMQDLQKNIPSNILIESNLAPAFIDEAIAHLKTTSKNKKEKNSKEKEVQNTEDQDINDNVDDLEDFNMDVDDNIHDFDCDDDLQNDPLIGNFVLFCLYANINGILKVTFFTFVFLSGNFTKMAVKARK